MIVIKGTEFKRLKNALNGKKGKEQEKSGNLPNFPELPLGTFQTNSSSRVNLSALSLLIKWAFYMLSSSFVKLSFQ